MAIKINSTKVNVPLIWTGDPSVDREASDFAAYSADPANSALIAHDGNATIFHCRPITHKERLQILDELAVSPLTSEIGRFNQQCIRALDFALVRVENLGIEDLEGEGGPEVVAVLPFNIVSELGLRVLTLSSAKSGAVDSDSAFQRLEDTRKDARDLVERLDPDHLDEEARDAFMRLRERLDLAPSESLDPDEDAGEDLPK